MRLIDVTDNNYLNVLSQIDEETKKALLWCMQDFISVKALKFMTEERLKIRMPNQDSKLTKLVEKRLHEYGYYDNYVTVNKCPSLIRPGEVNHIFMILASHPRCISFLSIAYENSKYKACTNACKNFEKEYGLKLVDAKENKS